MRQLILISLFFLNPIVSNACPTGEPAPNDIAHVPSADLETTEVVEAGFVAEHYQTLVLRDAPRNISNRRLEALVRHFGYSILPESDYDIQVQIEEVPGSEFRVLRLAVTSRDQQVGNNDILQASNLARALTNTAIYPAPSEFAFVDGEERIDQLQRLLNNLDNNRPILITDMRWLSFAQLEAANFHPPQDQDYYSLIWQSPQGGHSAWNSIFVGGMLREISNTQLEQLLRFWAAHYFGGLEPNYTVYIQIREPTRPQTGTRQERYVYFYVYDWNARAQLGTTEPDVEATRGLLRFLNQIRILPAVGGFNVVHGVPRGEGTGETYARLVALIQTQGGDPQQLPPREGMINLEARRENHNFTGSMLPLGPTRGTGFLSGSSM
ncbi:MAG: hypothetical protein JKY15_07405 [Deltaproteobacteria bacterium]|nr:hypothetical protein [Deltaproteobacteria bacterium]